MNVILSQSELKSALQIVSKAIPSRPSHPILANVLINSNNDSITLTGFDLSIGIKLIIPALVIDPIAFTVPCKLFLDIISRLPDGEIQLSCEESEKPTIRIECNSAKFSISGLASAEYPKMPQISSEESVSLSYEVLKEGVRNTAFSASNDETKQVLTGIHLSQKDDYLEFAATDGHRLAVSKQILENEVTINSVTLPSGALKDLISAAKDDIDMTIEDGHVQFESGNLTFISRILDGTYPAYMGLIPTDFKREVVINRKDLISAVDLVSVLIGQANIIRLDLDGENDQLIVSGDGKEIGTGRQKINAEITGESLALGLNSKYFLESLRVMESEEIRVFLNEATQPVVIKPLSGEDSLFLIMPVQLRD